MSRPRVARVLEAMLLGALLLVAVSLGGCAPPAGMIATLTMLPGTFTPLPPTRSPSNTPDLNATATETQQGYSYPSDTPTPGGTPEAPFAATLTSLALSETPGTPSPQTSTVLTMLAQMTLSETPGTPAPGIDATLTSLAEVTPGQAPETQTPGAGATVDATAAACPPFQMDTALPTPDVPASYIGRHYDNTALPGGLTWIGSGMLASADYSYTHVQWHGREMFWIEKLVCQNQAGTSFWEIRDALALPVLNAQAQQVYTDVCFRNGTQVPFSIAYGTYDPSQAATAIVPNFTGWRMQVSAAWQMEQRFTPLSLTGLTCVVQQP